MMSLFSSFDYKMFTPFMVFFILMNWNLNNTISMINSKMTITKKFYNEMNMFFLSLKPKKFNKMMKLMAMSCMTTLLVLNFTSVTSYNFALTSQFGMVMFLTLNIWFSYMLFMVTKNKKNLMIHWVPEGTPIYLTWFLFLIEMISNIIRPMTTTVRLVANILAGHLLMNLLSKLILKLNLLTPLYMVLNMIEFFVALIQAYIYVTMLMLFYSELE